MNQEISSLILQNTELAKYIEKLSIKLKINDTNVREMILVGFFNTARSHFIAINLLIEKKLYSSAFALVRVLFETIIKARYVYMFFEDDKIDEMYEKDNWDSIFKSSPNLGKMCQQIDAKIGENFYETIKNNAYKLMNDFTHTGAYQISSNFNEQNIQIESSFYMPFIGETLNSNFAVMKTFAIFSLEILGLKQEFLTEKEMNELLDFGNQNLIIGLKE